MATPLRLRSLRSQLALAFGVLVVALAVLLSVAFGTLLKGRIERDEGHQLRTAARLVAQTLADGLFERAREIEVLARSEELWTQGLGAPSVRRMLDRTQARQPDNTWIGVPTRRATSCRPPVA